MLFGRRPQPDSWRALCQVEDHLLGRRSGPKVDPALPFQRIVVGVDQAQGLEPALGWAAALQQEGATVWLVSVGAARGTAGTDLVTAQAFLEQADDPESSVRAATKLLAGLGGKGTPVVLRGTPAAALQEFLVRHQADLVILGSHHHGHGAYAGLGGVAQALKNTAPCSLLVARHGPAGAVWAATDGSLPARQALAVAADLAARMGAALTILHVLPEAPPTIPRPVSRAPAANAVASGRTLMGKPTRALIDEGLQTPGALLVMGSRGQSGGPLHGLGTVSDQVLADAATSVLIVRPRP